MKKSRRKTLPADLEKSQSQTGTPWRQMTITESFKNTKPKPFKMERPFEVSSVVIMIDSDSDVETPPQFASMRFTSAFYTRTREELACNFPGLDTIGGARIKVEGEPEALNFDGKIGAKIKVECEPEALSSNGKRDPPSPPKELHLIGVYKPDTSTPKNSPRNESVRPRTPGRFVIRSPHTPNLSSGSHNSTSTSTQTIRYSYDLNACNIWDEATIPFSLNQSALPSNISSEEALDSTSTPKNNFKNIFDSSNSESNTKKNTVAKRLDFDSTTVNNASEREKKRKIPDKIKSTDGAATDTIDPIPKKRRKKKVPNELNHDDQKSNNNNDITPKKRRKKKDSTESDIDSQKSNINNNVDTTPKKRRKKKTCPESNNDNQKNTITAKENSSPDQNLISTKKKPAITNINSITLTPPLTSSTNQTEYIGQQSLIEQVSSPIPQRITCKDIATLQEEGRTALPILSPEAIKKSSSNIDVLKKTENLNGIVDKLRNDKELSLGLIHHTPQHPPQVNIGMPKVKTSAAKFSPTTIPSSSRTQSRSLSLKRPDLDTKKQKATPNQASGKTDCSQFAKIAHRKETPRKIVDDGQKPCCSKDLVTENPTHVRQNTSITNRDMSLSKDAGANTSQNSCTTPEKQKVASNTSSQSSTSSSNTDSPTKNTQIMNLKCKKGKRFQTPHMDELVKLFKVAKTNRHLRALLNTYEYKILRKFENMEDDKKYFLMKLFIWQKVWYGIFKFCEKANIVFVDEKDIVDIRAYLSEEELVDTDYRTSASLSELLHRLNRFKVKEIMEELKIKPIKGKEENIKTMLAEAGRRATLTSKSFKDIIMDRVEKKMGMAIKIKDDVYNALYHVYLLATFTNPQFYKIEDYFNSIINHRVVFPEAPVEDYPVFYSRDKFLTYGRALQIKIDLDEKMAMNGENKALGIYYIAEEAYGQLFNFDPEDTNEHSAAPHLKKYTAQHVYTGVLSTCCEKIFSRKNGFPHDVKKWLEFLIKRFPNSRRLGRWYEILINLHMRHLNHISYESAAKLLIEALDTKRQVLGEISKYDLGELGHKLKSSKKYKIDQMNHDRITQLIPRAIDAENFPQHQIDSQCIRSEKSGIKRGYISKSNGEMTVRTVEEVAIKYYAEYGYPGGEHFEGRLVTALLVLFFYDIIYQSPKAIPGTFISKLQTAPLDMFTPYFYVNRKELIDQRLKEIESEWSEEKLINFAVGHWRNYSHERTAFGMIMDVIKDEPTVEVFIVVIGRKVLVKIFERLIKNIRGFSSGMPDLLVWNIDKQECKFVEVKGENDRLSMGQKLWLQYLRQSGALIEVCWVHSTGSKRKKIKLAETANQPYGHDEAGPSNRPA